MAIKKIILGSVNLSNVSPDYEWYPIVTGYNMEEQYVRNIMDAVSGTWYEPLIAEYYIPIKYTVANPQEVHDGLEKPKIKKEKGCYSSYVFVRCKMNEQLWTLLRTTTGASVIITTGGIPVPTTDEEIENIRLTQAPQNFEVNEAVSLLAKQFETYVKIVPGYNDDHPERKLEPDLESLKAWYEYARKLQKNSKKKKETKTEKPKKQSSPKNQQKKPAKKASWNDMRNKFK